MMIRNTTVDVLLSHFHHVSKKYNMSNVKTKSQKFPNLKDGLAKKANFTGIIK